MKFKVWVLISLPWGGTALNFLKNMPVFILILINFLENFHLDFGGRLK